MKKIVLITLMLLMITFSLSGCGKKTEDKMQADNKVATTDERPEQVTDVPEETQAPTNSDASEGKGGGNEFDNSDEKNNVETISILVSESEYIYENKPIELETFISIIKGFEGDVIVEITDNDATHKAYDNLIDELVELEVAYIEE